MRQPSLAHVCILTLLAALTACGEPTNPSKATAVRPVPAPRTVAATFDASLARTQTLPVGGGQVTVTGSDGTIYTLTVPAGALLGATEVTMTPLATLTGVPVEGRAHAVLLEPSGLRLFEPATLEVAPADATTGNAIGYAASVDGSDFHLVPPLLGGDGASVSFRLFGFSQHGGFTGTNSAPITMSESPEAFSPANWEAQLQHMLAELYSAERHSQLSGAPGDAALEAKVEAIQNTFYLEEVAPLLSRIAADCSFAEANLGKALAWVRATVLIGLEATFSHEIDTASNAVRSGANRCWEEAIAPCIDQNSPSFDRVLRVARTNLLLGGSSTVYDPARTELQCSGSCSWIGATEALDLSVNFSWAATGTDVDGAVGTVKRSWVATAVLEHPDRYDSTIDFSARTAAGDAVDGTFRVADALNPPGGDPVTTAGTGALGSANFNVRFDTEACTFTAGFQADGPATTIGPDGETRHNLTIGTVNLLEERASQGGMGASQTLPHSSAAGGRSHFSYGQSAGSLPMRGAEGTALVTWTLSPVGAP